VFGTWDFPGITVGNGLITAPSISFANDTDTGFYFTYVSGQRKIHVCVGGVDVMQFTDFSGITQVIAFVAPVTTFEAATSVTATSPTFIHAGVTGGATPVVQFREDPDNGSNYFGLKAADNMAASYTVAMPAAAPTANKQVLEFTTGGVATFVSKDPHTKAVTVESPGASEDITMFFTDDAITITQLNAIVRGTTPSVTWTIRHATDRSATGNEVVTGGTATTSQTTGSEVTSFNDATIPAGSWVWLETTAQTGTVNELNVTLEYTFD
jgi:hypothetical protein